MQLFRVILVSSLMVYAFGCSQNKNNPIDKGKQSNIVQFPHLEKQGTAARLVVEGTFEDGKWVAKRRLNGDEVHASTWDWTGLKFPGDKPAIQKISLYHYK